MNKKHQRLSHSVLWILLATVSTGILGYGCSGSGMQVGTDTSASSSDTSTGYLTLLCDSSTVGMGSSTRCYANGGTAPYTYLLQSGLGSINSSTGVYTAPTTQTYAQLEVIDSKGTVAYDTLSVYSTTGSTSSSTVSIATAPVYRFYHSTYGHFFSMSSTEGTNAGYTYEGVPFYLITTAGVAGTHAVYRCVNSSSVHFMSLELGCEGSTNEGLMGYMYDASQTGTVLINRYHWKDSTGSTRDFMSVSPTDYTNYLATYGYILDGYLGYAISP